MGGERRVGKGRGGSACTVTYIIELVWEGRGILYPLILPFATSFFAVTSDSETSASDCESELSSLDIRIREALSRPSRLPSSGREQPLIRPVPQVSHIACNWSTESNRGPIGRPRLTKARDLLLWSDIQLR